MAPQPIFDTDQIKDRARKDILYLLEGVRKASQLSQYMLRADINPALDTRKEELGHRTISGWASWDLCQVLDSAGLWSG